MMPILFLAFKASDDHFLYSTDHFFFPFFIISVIVLILLYFIGLNPILANNRIDAIFVIALAFVYSYGSTRQINFVFDNSKPKVFKAVILDKTEHYGRHTSYYLTISSWGPTQQSERVENNNGLYDRVKIGDTVKVNFKQGVLRMPWYYLSQ